MRTFMDEIRAGWTTPEKIDDYIGRWHDATEDGVPLHEFLGLTWDEYKRWGEHNVLPRHLDNAKAGGAPTGSRWGYLPCGCTHDGYGDHLR